MQQERIEFKVGLMVIVVLVLFLVVLGFIGKWESLSVKRPKECDFTGGRIPVVLELSTLYRSDDVIRT